MAAAPFIMADKRYRSGAYDSSRPKRNRSNPSRSSASYLTHPSTPARQPSTIGSTGSSDSLMYPDQYHPFSVPPPSLFSLDSSLPSLPPKVSVPQTDSDHQNGSPSYSEQGWCYRTASPEPMDYGDQDDGNDLAASMFVFPPQSQRPTFAEEKQAEKERAKEGRKKRSHTNNPDVVQSWEADPKGYLMSQGAMEDEGHRYYGGYFDIPVSKGVQTPYPYAEALDIEDLDGPEPNGRPENIDVAANRRVGWADQTQEEEEWDDCVVEEPYPGSDGFENDQGQSTAQWHYRAGAASWLPSLYRH